MCFNFVYVTPHPIVEHSIVMTVFVFVCLPVSISPELHIITRNRQRKKVYTTEVYILCRRELSRCRLLPAVSPAAGHIITAVIIDFQGCVEIFAQRPPRLAQFNAR